MSVIPNYPELCSMSITSGTTRPPTRVHPAAAHSPRGGQARDVIFCSSTGIMCAGSASGMTINPSRTRLPWSPGPRSQRY